MGKKSVIPITLTACIGFMLLMLLLRVGQVDRATALWLLDGAGLLGMLAGYGIDRLRGI